jgi:hypothetical protein
MPELKNPASDHFPLGDFQVAIRLGERIGDFVLTEIDHVAE